MHTFTFGRGYIRIGTHTTIFSADDSFFRRRCTGPVPELIAQPIAADFGHTVSSIGVIASNSVRRAWWIGRQDNHMISEQSRGRLIGAKRSVAYFKNRFHCQSKEIDRSDDARTLPAAATHRTLEQLAS